MIRGGVILLALAGIPVAGLVGCSTAPKTSAERLDLKADADRVMAEAQRTDPTLRDFMARSAGYAVFPDAGKGGFIAGGGYGKGVLYEHGVMIGYCDMTQGTFGAQIGGQSFAEILCFETPEKLNQFKDNQFINNIFLPGPYQAHINWGWQKHITGKPVAGFEKLVVWGNHSPTMYADYRFATSNGDNVKALVNDAVWNNDVFLPTVGKRGAAIIEARGLSSAASAANAAIDHVRDWVLGSSEWVTMGVPSDGSYGIPEGVVYGFPCECKNGDYKIIQGLEIDEYSRGKMNATLAELEEERAAVASML